MGPTPKLPEGNYLVSQQAKLSVRVVLGIVGDSVKLVRPDTKETELRAGGRPGVHGSWKNHLVRQVSAGT